jgi:FtsH-binding integral membrane protein
MVSSQGFMIIYLAYGTEEKHMNILTMCLVGAILTIVVSVRLHSPEVGRVYSKKSGQRSKRTRNLWSAITISLLMLYIVVGITLTVPGVYVERLMFVR